MRGLHSHDQHIRHIRCAGLPTLTDDVLPDLLAWPALRARLSLAVKAVPLPALLFPRPAAGGWAR